MLESSNFMNKEKDKSDKSWVERHPVWTGIFILIFLGMVFGSDDNSSQENSKPKLASLKAEVNSGGTGFFYDITNRNDYTWHNLTIVIDDYYTCVKNGELEPQASIGIRGMNCGDWFRSHMSNAVITSIKISTDEGEEYFTLQKIN